MSWIVCKTMLKLCRTKIPKYIQIKDSKMQLKSLKKRKPSIVNPLHSGPSEAIFLLKPAKRFMEWCGAELKSQYSLHPQQSCCYWGFTSVSHINILPFSYFIFTIRCHEIARYKNIRRMVISASFGIYTLYIIKLFHKVKLTLDTFAFRDAAKSLKKLS